MILYPIHIDHRWHYARHITNQKSTSCLLTSNRPLSSQRLGTDEIRRLRKVGIDSREHKLTSHAVDGADDLIVIIGVAVGNEAEIVHDEAEGSLVNEHVVCVLGVAVRGRCEYEQAIEDLLVGKLVVLVVERVRAGAAQVGPGEPRCVVEE